MIRQPAVAGQFYSSDPDELQAEVQRYHDPAAVRQAATAGICPHAGLMYSGHVAGALFSRLSLPTVAILIGPNHREIGPPISIYPEGTWLIPGGAVTVHAALAATLLQRFPLATADTTAHEREHCLEVLLPFLRRPAHPAVQIVPILLRHAHREVYRDFGQCLAEALRDIPGSPEPSAGAPAPLLLASTDLNHYEPAEITRRKDRQAIQAIQNLDADALDEAIRTHRISMCGYGATMTVLHAARSVGARQASLVKYATSGDITGDRSSVVGYAALTIAR
jgi:AmmeMemoRadiSam system protein B